MSRRTDSKKYDEWLNGYASGTINQPARAATVVLIRQSQDKEENLEVLMLKRNPELKFIGGFWVFPGGKTEESDILASRNTLQATENAAVRETMEETGLKISKSSLVRYSHWVPPSTFEHIFATWFFVALAPDLPVQVDESEIVEHRWIDPAEALRLRNEGEMEYLPPTFVTLFDLAQEKSVKEFLKKAKKHKPVFYATRFDPDSDQSAAMWEGDAGYESRKLDTPGSRNRLWMNNGKWELERSE